MNESIFDRIKDKAAEKKQQKIDAENKLKEETARRVREEQREELRKRQEKEDNENFNLLFKTVQAYIFQNYQDCEISIPRQNYLTVEKHDLRYKEQLDFEFKVTLNNTVVAATFEVEIVLGNKKYNYTASGLVYIPLKNFFGQTIYEWYKMVGYARSKSQQQSNYYGSQGSSRGTTSGSQGSSRGSTSSGTNGSSGTNERPKPNSDYSYKKANETDEEKKKRKLYILLKDTLSGYYRQQDTIKEWEKKNPGKTHPDKLINDNEIKAVKNKINLLNSKFHFESKYYLKHLNPILS